jgi:hypothetical protein
MTGPGKPEMTMESAPVVGVDTAGGVAVDRAGGVAGGIISVAVAEGVGSGGGGVGELSQPAIKSRAVAMQKRETSDDERDLGCRTAFTESG